MRSEFHRTALTTIVTVIISITSTEAANVSATGRDPFRPPSSPICMPGAEPPQAWRLGGIIGRDADYLAWLAYANGKWQPRRPAALLDAH